MTQKKGGEAPNQLCCSNSTFAQRKRILEAQREGLKSAIWIRRELDVLMPAARIFELRHNEGFNIQTNRRYESTDVGKQHSVAEYILMPGQW